MTNTDRRHTHRSGAPTSPDSTATRGPLRRIVVGSLTCGAVGAAGLFAGPFAGAVEHVTTGVVLLGFAAGWAMLAALTIRNDEPAAALGRTCPPASWRPAVWRW